jgi:hypothetical protein
MVHPKASAPSFSASPALKACPWCRGGLLFTRTYPVTQIAPGESRRLHDVGIPEALRMVPAWTCATPHCRYRESA